MTITINVVALKKKKKVFASYIDNLIFFYFLLTKIEYEKGSFNLTFSTGTSSRVHFCNYC